MEIEIITTKKKLTKSILRQMYRLSYSDFSKAKSLGFIRCVFRPDDFYILCKIDKNYYLLDGLHEMRGKVNYYYAGYNYGYGRKRCECIKRLNPEIATDWFKKYNTLVQKGKELGQIFI